LPELPIGNPRQGPTRDEDKPIDIADAACTSPVNCQQDIALPHSYPWYPRLSERLGLFRLIECPGSHEMWFSNPPRLAQAIIEAGRD
jgi:hypothetical protein